MSFHSGPEGVPPDDQRCEALVRGKSGLFYEWTKHDHRCAKRANQSRGSLAVCHIHARTKVLERWLPTSE